MNASQIHLALTHVPVILSLTGMIMLGISFIMKKNSLAQTGLYILIIAAVTAVPVFFTGEGAEEVAEKLPGVNETTIGKHESIAKIAFAVIIATGVVAAIGVLRFLNTRIMKNASWLTLVLAIVSSVLMIQSAHLGGQIRHTEVANTVNGGAQENNNTGENDDDD